MALVTGQVLRCQPRTWLRLCTRVGYQLVAAHDGLYGGCVRQLDTPTSTGLQRRYSNTTEQEVTTGARTSVEDQLSKLVALSNTLSATSGETTS